MGSDGIDIKPKAHAAKRAASDRLRERTCALTRVTTDPSRLIRFVCDPDGVVIPDVRHKLPGRGVWIGCRHTLVADAAKKGAFKRGFHADLHVPADLPEQVEVLLARRAQEALALANKAGLVTTGNAKVEAAIGAGRIRALAQGCDAAEGGRRKMWRRLQRDSAARGQTPVLCEELTIDEMSLALGRANVVHAGLGKGSATDLFVQASERLRRFRSDAPFQAGAEHEATTDTVTAGDTPRRAAQKTGKV